MPKIVLILSGAALATSLILLIWLVGSGYADVFDLPLRQTLLALDPPVANRAWRFVTLLGSGLVVTVLSTVCILIFAARGQWRTAFHIVLVMVGAVIVENTLKYVVHRQRPEEIFGHTMPPTYSFPSGHALFAFAFYASVASIFANHLNRTARLALGAVAASIIILIGASRIFLGVHYPTDVLGGYIAASLWLILVQLRYKY